MHNFVHEAIVLASSIKKECIQKKIQDPCRLSSKQTQIVFTHASKVHFRPVKLVHRGKPQVGNLPLSPLFCTGSFLKDVLYWPHNYFLEKNQVPRELTLIAISLACLVAQ
jgi:hypothetical protein